MRSTCKGHTLHIMKQLKPRAASSFYPSTWMYTGQRIVSAQNTWTSTCKRLAIRHARDGNHTPMSGLWDGQQELMSMNPKHSMPPAVGLHTMLILLVTPCTPLPADHHTAIYFDSLEAISYRSKQGRAVCEGNPVRKPADLRGDLSVVRSSVHHQQPVHVRLPGLLAHRDRIPV